MSSWRGKGTKDGNMRKPTACAFLVLLGAAPAALALACCGAVLAVPATALAQGTTTSGTPPPSRVELRENPARHQPGQNVAPDRPSRGSVYLHGGLALPWRPGVTGEQSQTYVAEPGGWTTGWVAGGGAFLYGFMSLEGELSMTGTMKAVEPSRYFMTFIEERRDLFIVANVRFHTRLFSAVTLEPLAGFAVVRREAWSQVDRMRYRGADWVLERGTREPQELPPGVGIAAGADLRIGGRHVAILPSFRVFRMTVSDEFVNHYPGGATGWTIRPAILLRVDFPVS